MDSRTGQCQQFVANKDGRVVLVLVQGVLAPVPQELLHGRTEGIRRDVEKGLRTIGGLEVILCILDSTGSGGGHVCCIA